jgi:hypothetical protein
MAAVKTMVGAQSLDAAAAADGVSDKAAKKLSKKEQNEAEMKFMFKRDAQAGIWGNELEYGSVMEGYLKVRGRRHVYKIHTYAPTLPSSSVAVRCVAWSIRAPRRYPHHQTMHLCH